MLYAHGDQWQGRPQETRVCRQIDGWSATLEHCTCDMPLFNPAELQIQIQIAVLRLQRQAATRSGQMN